MNNFVDSIYFYFLLLTVQYSNTAAYNQTLNKKLKKKAALIMQHLLYTFLYNIMFLLQPPITNCIL
jgi:hypothetical protein